MQEIGAPEKKVIRVSLRLNEIHKNAQIEEVGGVNTLFYLPFPLGVHATNPEARKTILEPVFPNGKVVHK